MAVTFLEPGGDATFNVFSTTNGGLWGAIVGGPTVATDFVHGSHIKSIQYHPAVDDEVQSPTGVLADSGSRFSFYIYIVAYPTTDSCIFNARHQGVGTVFMGSVSSTGVLKLWANNVLNQLGSNGTALSIGQWYRISVAYTITDTTHNEIRLFKNGVIDISVTNGTLSRVTTDTLYICNFNTDATLDFRTSDHYIDNDISLTDTGDVWITAKRPNANGTANNFSTQIGAGSSGYGSGHSPQVNERPLSISNGWSIIAVGATTEEYNIENRATGDFNLSSRGINAQIVDYMGWVYAKSLTSETANIVINGVSSNISLTSTATTFTKMAGSIIYPSGTGTDIGIITDATATTVSLYECGIIVAYIPVPNGKTFRKGREYGNLF